MNGMTGIAVGVVVPALVIRRQLRVRPVREATSLVLTGVLGVLGVVWVAFGVASVTGHHTLPAATWAVMAAIFAVATGFGVLRAMTVRVWRGSAGEALRKGTAATVGLWLLSVAVHFALDAWLDGTVAAGALGATTLLPYLAVTLGVQELVVRRRVV